MLKHYNITAKGKVQGVWYRKSTQEKANEIGIKGFVKNQSDGSVYIEAEGNENQLKSLLEWCAEGPEFAMVDTISYTENDVQFFKQFKILH